VKGVMTLVVYPLFHIQTRRSDRPSRVKAMSTQLCNLFLIKEDFGAGGRRSADGSRAGRGSARSGDAQRGGVERDVFNRGNLTPVRHVSMLSCYQWTDAMVTWKW
jgi:hypothetical protein